ncbi:Proprotein convertase subtilisin/kexin type 9 [Branchiostoma belcheri]|nr:Proprotein convertase subtilisin/kexin type 9 [Branchiostoma belcheri]
MLGGNICYHYIVVFFLLTSLVSFGDGRRPPRSVAGRVPGLPSYVTVDGFNMARDGLRPMYRAPDDNSRIPGRYIVVMKDTSGSDAVQDVMGKYRYTVLSAQSEGRRRGHPDVIDMFHMEPVDMNMNILKGFISEMTPSDVSIMRTMPDVEYIEEDQVFEKQSAVPWHLDRIDQQDLPLDGLFNRQPKFVSEAMECPAGYHPSGDACFKAFDKAKKYGTAEAVCEGEGGILAEPRNRTVNEFLLKLLTSLNPGEKFWIGLTDREKEGTWRWNNGEELDRNSFTAWAEGEPNQAGDCAVVKANSKWNDVPCRWRHRFICQRPPFVSRQVYVGCYRARVGGLTSDVTVDDESLIPTSCINHCTSEGYRYAGLQFGNECLCGDSLSQLTWFGSEPESECDTPCTGDAAEACGGNKRTSIYRTITGAPSTLFYPACYIKQGTTLYKLYSEARTYASAREVCAADGGHLADVRTEAIHNFLVRAARAVQPGRDYWIGLNDQKREGRWVWSDGSRLREGDFANWAAGEPNNSGQLGSQNCGQLWAARGFLWDDDNCNEKDYFICEISLAPKRWREDLRCGHGYPAEDGRPAECDPDSMYPCCSPLNWCGNTKQHCDCQRCVDYRNTDSVDVYIVDSGIRYTHEEFEGRAVWSGFDAHADDSNKGNDLEGHGTHVAALVGGRTFGVNPRVLLRSVRVLDSTGGGSTSSVLRGLNHIGSVTSNSGARGVVVMSLTSRGGSPSVDKASRRLVLLGLPVVVAAGNYGDDACNHSPGREAEAGITEAINTYREIMKSGVQTPRGTPPVAGIPPGHISYVTDQMNRIKPMPARLLNPAGASRGYIPDGHRRNWDLSLTRLVITVGGTRITDGLYDRTEEGGGATSYGSCVDIFAPAQEVLSAGVECDSCSDVRSGTSQAAPIAAGVVTKLLSRDPSLTPAQIRLALLSTAATNKLDFSTLPEDSRLKTPNKLLQVPTVPLKETAACRTVWSLQSDREEGSVAAAACNVNETLLSCSSVTDGVHTGEFTENIPNGKPICVAENAKAGSSVYALARCCVLPGSLKCYIKTQKPSNKKAISALAKCDQNPRDVLTGCSVSGDGGVVRHIRGQECLARGKRPEAHAFCCRGNHMDCWKVRSQFSLDDEVVARCHVGSVLTGCSTRGSEGAPILGARAVDMTCIAHKPPDSTRTIQAIAICCSVKKR